MQLALVNRRVLVRVQKLDRIFDGDDVVVVSLVDQIDNRRERGTLAASGWSSDQHDAVFDIYYLFQLFRQIEIAELRRPHRDHAHDDRVCAALLEDIDAETRVARSAERQVGRARLFEAVERRLLIADNQFRDARGMGRQSAFPDPRCEPARVCLPVRSAAAVRD